MATESSKTQKDADDFIDGVVGQASCYTINSIQQCDVTLVLAALYLSSELNG